MDIMSKVFEAFATQPDEEWPRVLMPLSNQIQQLKINVVLVYWPVPWSVITLFAVIIIVTEILFFGYPKIESKILQSRNEVRESNDPN